CVRDGYGSGLDYW
nr:immunoglobulin heavy chain junction region [Macaca mulatta]MOY17888.1 immunoglobulin heavy chain junction region [Macaca mulatta]MOY17972.1 immunoglobulin heavy chain junction region [Macaca mulatta]MOY18165.1 immunoglobulin heavy chain junction region [Macaca mulatta]MOY18207.1 immunoglobulin heavy chain junction region [Macaca mulatta]